MAGLLDFVIKVCVKWPVYLGGSCCKMVSGRLLCLYNVTKRVINSLPTFPDPSCHVLWWAESKSSKGPKTKQLCCNTFSLSLQLLKSALDQFTSVEIKALWYSLIEKKGIFKFPTPQCLITTGKVDLAFPLCISKYFVITSNKVKLWASTNIANCSVVPLFDQLLKCNFFVCCPIGIIL